MRLFWLLGTADLGSPIFLPGGVSILEEFIGWGLLAGVLVTRLVGTVV